MTEQLDIDGIRIVVRRNARARRMTLRVPRDGAGVVLTLPRGVSRAEAERFAQAKSDWLRRALDRVPPAQLVVEGGRIPVAGQILQIRTHAARAARVEGASLLVPRRGQIGAQVQGFLKTRARDALATAVDRYATALGRRPTALSLRDTRSRWGSCTQDGRLMFSWRLAMAPPEVLDYVAAHEVAHLAHMDHSPRFWAQVEALKPGYAPHRAWLRQHGVTLQAWRFKED